MHLISHHSLERMLGRKEASGTASGTQLETLVWPRGEGKVLIQSHEFIINTYLWKIAAFCLVALVSPQFSLVSFEFNHYSNGAAGVCLELAARRRPHTASQDEPSSKVCEG